MDTFSKNKRSEIMRRVKSTETKLEKTFRTILWREGLRYIKNSSAYGKPDLIIRKRKLVIFIDSCFWHGCKKHLRMPGSNKTYWLTKIERNKKRDQEVNSYYLGKKWKIFRIWEHVIADSDSLSKQVENILNHIRR